MPSNNLKKITPSVRNVYKHLEKLVQNNTGIVTPMAVAQASGFTYSAEIGTQLGFLYSGGYVGKQKTGNTTQLSILKPLPPV